jgi:hypothetical protein
LRHPPETQANIGPGENLLEICVAKAELTAEAGVISQQSRPNFQVDQRGVGPPNHLFLFSLLNPTVEDDGQFGTILTHFQPTLFLQSRLDVPLSGDNFSVHPYESRYSLTALPLRSAAPQKP